MGARTRGTARVIDRGRDRRRDRNRVRENMAFAANFAESKL